MEEERQGEERQRQKDLRPRRTAAKPLRSILTDANFLHQFTQPLNADPIETFMFMMKLDIKRNRV